MTFETREDMMFGPPLPLEGWWCLVCGEAIFDGQALMLAEEATLKTKDVK